MITGIDFGGTTIKLGLVSERGDLLEKTRIPFDHRKSLVELINSVCEPLEALIASTKGDLTAIGIATPGYADPETGILIDGTNNVPVLLGHSLPALFGDRFGVPAFIDNDGICAVTGELLFGAGRGFRNFVLITLGTGLGGGIVINGEVVTGRKGQPPEIGAICLDPEGPVNFSGIRGTFERLACASGVVDLYMNLSGRQEPTLTAEEVFRFAKEGDGAALFTLDRVARHIAQAFGIMINLLNLDACIIGGGISAAGPTLLEAVRKHLPSFTWPLLYRHAQVLLARLGNDAGVIGAAAMAMRRLANEQRRPGNISDR